MNENTRYQYKIEIVDVNDQSVVGSKTVQTTSEAVDVLNHDVVEDEWSKCDECGMLEHELFSFVIEGKMICQNCWDRIIKMDAEIAKEEEAEVLFEFADEYNQVVAEQQSSRKPNTQTI